MLTYIGASLPVTVPPESLTIPHPGASPGAGTVMEPSRLRYVARADEVSQGDVPECRRPDLHPSDARGRQRFRILDRADPAAELPRHGRRSLDHRPCELDRCAPVTGGSERDHVDEGRGGGGR